MLELLQVPKTMPHSEESERAVLAAVLLDPRLLASVSSRLNDQDFYAERHKLLYAAMLELQEGQTPIDLRTLQAKLEQRGQLVGVGGISYLSGLEIDLPDLGRFEKYVEIVKERSVRRRIIEVCSQIARDSFDGGMDAQQALDRAEQAVLALGEEAIARGFKPFSKIIEETMEMLEEDPSLRLMGLSTGFADFDRMTHGLGRGQLIIVAGRPGMGKTSFALNMAQHVAIELKKTVGIFSLEMGEQELALRILSAKANVPFSSLRSGFLSQAKMTQVIQTMSEVAKAPLFIDDSANPTLLEIASKARRLKEEKNLALLVVDYLQLMQAGGKFENRNLEVSAMTRAFKQLAKELAIPVIVLSQLSRQPERRGGDHRPQLADLRESGAIEQDADLVVFIYRDEVYNKEDPSVKNLAELIIAKHRNGETGTVELVFMGETTRFASMARDASGGPHG